MAVTVTRNPLYIVPAYNAAEFLATSTQTAQPNFVYYVKVTIDTAEEYIHRIPPAPDGSCYFNAVAYTRKYIENYYPFGEYDVQSHPGLRGFTVNIGEEYGSTPTIYAGTDYSFNTWNASLTKKERSIYNPDDYMSLAIDGECKLLNIFPNTIKLKQEQDLVLSWIQFDTFFPTITINTYLSTGVLRDTITIDTDIAAFPLYLNFNVGPESLNTFQSTVAPTRYTSSILPWFDSSVAYYDVSVDGTNYIRINIIDPCDRFVDYPLYYLNRQGAFDYINMQGNHKDVFNIEKKFYKGLSNNFEASYEITSGPTLRTLGSPLSISDKTLNISYEETLTLLSQPLDQSQLDIIKDLYTSPYTFINTGAYDYVKYSCKDTQYQLKRDIIEKIIQLEAVLNAGVTEVRQIE
jgi:hypothetical protein